MVVSRPCGARILFPITGRSPEESDVTRPFYGAGDTELREFAAASLFLLEKANSDSAHGGLGLQGPPGAASWRVCPCKVSASPLPAVLSSPPISVPGTLAMGTYKNTPCTRARRSFLGQR